MGFPTDVRSKNVSGWCGIDSIWSNNGTDLADNETRIIVGPTNKAGRLNGVLMLSKHPEVELWILLDGVGVLGGLKERPSWLWARHGCTGEFGFVVLQRYDTINNKYIVLVKGPLEFGNSLQVYFRNPGTGVAIKCCAVVDWLENT